MYLKLKNIKSLKIKKHENLEFTIMGQIYQSPSEIKESIFKEQINQLTIQFRNEINILKKSNKNF